MRLRSAEQGRSLIQQASCCVAVAERALGFRQLTGDDDADKLLVTPTDSAHLEYRFPGRQSLSVETAGLKAHIAGSLSFAVCSDYDVSTVDDSLFDERLPSQYTTRSPRFSKNVKWLAAVLNCVMLKLRSEVPETRASAEKAVFEELQSWQDQLRRCSSVDEFITT